MDCSGIKKAMRKRIVAANRRLIHNNWISANLLQLKCKSKLISKDAAELQHNIRLLVQDRNISCFVRRKRAADNMLKMAELLCGIENECRDIQKQIRNRIKKTNRRRVMENNRLARLRALDWKLKAIHKAATSITYAKYAAVDDIDAAYMDEWLDGHLPIEPVIDTPRTQNLTP